MTEQAARLLHAQAGVVYHEPMLRLVEVLLPLVPAGLGSFFFSSSGAQAVEASLKLARRFSIANRARIVPISSPSPTSAGTSRRALFVVPMAAAPGR